MAARQGATGDSPSASAAGAGIMSALPCGFKKILSIRQIDTTSSSLKNYFPAGLTEGNNTKFKKRKGKQGKRKCEKSRNLLFVLRHSLPRYRAKEYIIPNDARLTCCCLSVIDKSWERRYLNVKPGCFSPIRITV